METTTTKNSWDPWVAMEEATYKKNKTNMQCYNKSKVKTEGFMDPMHWESPCAMTMCVGHIILVISVLMIAVVLYKRMPVPTPVVPKVTG